MGAAAQGGNKRAGAPSLLPGGRWAAVLAGAVMLAQCTASSAAADPTVRPVTAAELGASWHPGCPVEPGQLRRVDVDHIGFDGQTHRGELIVHQDLAPQVVTIFARLYRLGFSIEKIRTVDHYRDADDELSMEDDNTSAFNCRGIPGSDRWSEHAYGRAIDLNPRLNPCLYPTGAFQPQNARGLSGPRPHRPGPAARRRPGRARLHRQRVALGWTVDGARRLPAFRAALKQPR